MLRHAGAILAIVALLAVAVWLGGLTALGAVAAPVVFSTVPWPSSADAMSIVFRRFDAVAMACAAIVLATEAAATVAGIAVLARGPRPRVPLAARRRRRGRRGRHDLASHRRAPRRRARSVAWARPGLELARLHDCAERCGKTELVLLAARPGPSRRPSRRAHRGSKRTDRADGPETEGTVLGRLAGAQSGGQTPAGRLHSTPRHVKMGPEASSTVPGSGISGGNSWRSAIGSGSRRGRSRRRHCGGLFEQQREPSGERRRGRRRFTGCSTAESS